MLRVIGGEPPDRHIEVEQHPAPVSSEIRLCVQKNDASASRV
jgi:hypothetical protein